MACSATFRARTNFGPRAFRWPLLYARIKFSRATPPQIVPPPRNVHLSECPTPTLLATVSYRIVQPISYSPCLHLLLTGCRWDPLGFGDCSYANKVPCYQIDLQAQKDPMVLGSPQAALNNHTSGIGFSSFSSAWLHLLIQESQLFCLSCCICSFFRASDGAFPVH